MAGESVRLRLGVDTGGTFTDCVSVDLDSGAVAVEKVPTHPEQPQLAILDGVQRLASRASQTPDVESVVYGTTIATNAVITGDYARIGLITTRGARDVIEVGTQQRPKLYNLRQQPVPVLVPRDLRIEVSGRLAADGTEIEPLDPDEVRAAIQSLTNRGVQAFAVAGLFSFINGSHERTIAELICELESEAYVGCSSVVSQEPREYQRMATTTVNAALSPRIGPYVSALAVDLAKQVPGARLFVMQSNGGIATAERSGGEAAHQLILSGPAAGVIGASAAAAQVDSPHCVSFDVGGTSADIGMVVGGRARTAIAMALPSGLPCVTPHVEVTTIGAGGGSIARVDAGGSLTVGPESAGAAPGPACYAQGGTAPTVTDAHLVLGRLPEAGLIGGGLSLRRDLAEQAITGVAADLDIGLEAAALGILSVLEENMAGAIRSAAAAHGDDLREFVLVAGGGAGPLHAAGIAATLGMRAALIPRHPGLLSAIGLLGAAVRHDFRAPLLADEAIPKREIESRFAELSARAHAAMDADGITKEDRGLEYAVDVRYFGQAYSLQVAVDPAAPEALEQDFHIQHERTFGHAAEDAPIETVAVRVAALGHRPVNPRFGDLASEGGSQRGTRDVYFDAEQGPEPADVFNRGQLATGQIISGPAIVEQLDTTTLVPPDFVAVVHPSGSLLVSREQSDG